MSSSPSGRRSRSLVAIAIARKFARRLISSASSTNRCSSAPQLYRLIAQPALKDYLTAPSRKPRLQRRGVEIAAHEPRLVEQLGQHRRRRRDAFDGDLAQRPPRPRQARRAIRAPDDQLGQQRVVERRGPHAPPPPRGGAPPPPPPPPRARGPARG